MSRAIPSRLRPLAVAAVAAFALVGCADGQGRAASGDCGPVEALVDEGHHHLVGDAEPPVDYQTTPPASGWHPRGIGEELLGVHEEPLREPEHVGVLAVDGVVISYHGLEDDAVEELIAIVGRSDRPVALTPYDALDEGQVAVTAWAVKQVCDGVDAQAVEAFIAEHAAEDPDFTMGGEHDHDGEHDRDE